MGKLSFLKVEPGQIVFYEGSEYKITHILSLTEVLGKRLSDGKVETIQVEMIRQIPTPSDENSAVVEERGGRDIFDYSQEEWAEGQRRFMLIRDVLSDPNRSRKDIEKIAADNNIHTATIYRWISLYLDAGHVGVLIPLPRGRKTGSRYLAPEVEEIINSVIKRDYLKPKPDRPIRVIATIMKECKAAQLSPPHENTIRNRLQAIPESERLRKTGQTDVLLAKHTPSKGHLTASHPLEIVQIDHTPADIELVDDTYRKPLGRPWITVAIDIFTRIIIGFFISFERPSAMAAGMCVAMGMCPKREYLAELEVPGEWPVWGRIGTLHADNAKEFKGKTLEMACAKHHINTKFRKVKTPHYGGHIESLMDTLGDEIRDLPGAIIKRKPTGATLTLKEFEVQFADLIVNVYHERSHSGLKKQSPMAVWKKAIMGDGQTPGMGMPRIPGDPDTVRYDFMPLVMRTIQTEGVQYEHIQYYSGVLDRWMGTIDPATNKGQKFIFHVSRRDISCLYFYEPDTKLYHPIPYRDTSHPPISFYELKEIERFLESNNEPINEEKIFEARERIGKRNDEATKKTKQMRRLEQRQKETAETVAKSKGKPTTNAPQTGVSGNPATSTVPSTSIDLDAIFATPIVPFGNRRVGS